MTFLRIPLVMAAVAVLGACEEERPTAEVIRPVRAITLGDTATFSSRTFPGRATATREVNLAFEVPGRLTGRPVDVGDDVTEGQLLARLDPRDYSNARDAAVARRAQAEAFRDRIAQAAKTGAVAQQELTDAEAAYEVAVAEVNIHEKALADTELRAPFPGTIAATFAENFQNVLAKQAVMRLLDTSRIEMVVDVPESLISNVPYVVGIEVVFDAFPDRPVTATIKKVGTEATLTTRTFPVTLIMDQPDDFTILPGMAGMATGRAQLPGGLEQGFEIPSTALFEADGQTCIWILQGDGGDGVFTVTRRTVQPTRLTGRGVRVPDLGPGTRVATAGVHYLREGQRVRLLEEGA